VSKNKTEKFFLDPLLLFLVVEEKKTEENKRKTEENTKFHTFEKRAKFDFPRCVPKRERILPNKTSKKRRESKQKKHERFASLKISHASFVVFVALCILLLLLLSNTLLIEERLERERVFTTRVIDIAFFKVAEETKVYLFSVNCDEAAAPRRLERPD
jgi:hypothetical protein